MIKTFPRGLNISHNKSLTDSLDIEIMPPPKTVYIPLLQHIGSESDPIVKVGDEVVKGQLIASKQNGVNIHSSVCGTVKAIEDRVTSLGKCKHIVIENNFSNNNAHLKPLTNPSSQEIIERVEQCGICGMGGAGFPTSTKLNVKNKIDELIINGAECEPYVTCDHRIMLEYTAKLMGGILLMQKAVNASRVIIGIENNKQNAINKINEYIEQNKVENVSVVALKPKYPQGSDKQLIYSLTGKKIAKGVRSSSLGVVVTNIHTAFSVFLAVNEGWQSYSRIMTVSGDSVKNPKNILVANGTLYEDILAFCGGEKEDNPSIKVINGGPMMGASVYSLQISANKTTSCLLFLSKNQCSLEKVTQCINCGRCSKVCPMNLMPMYIDSMAQSGLILETVKYGVNYCIECGCCAYICPSKRNLVQSITLAKKKLKEKGIK